MLGDNLFNNKDAEISNIKYTDCISSEQKNTKNNNSVSPLESLLVH